MKVTVRMTRQTSKKSSVRSISSRHSQNSIKTQASTASAGTSKNSILRHSKSLAALHDPTAGTSSGRGQSGNNNYVKRSRTMDALLEIGAFPPDFSEPCGPENLLESSSEATLLCKESKHKRTRFFDEATYDNPLMMKISGDESTVDTNASDGSQTELQLFMDRQGSKQSIHSEGVSSSLERTSNDSPVCVITPLKSDFDSPRQSPITHPKHKRHSDGGCNSESDSQNEAQRRFRLNKCLKWRTLPYAAGSSKDSGYGDTTSPCTPCTPCQDGEMLPMQDFKIVDETCPENEDLMGDRDAMDKVGSTPDSPASSRSSCYPLSSIEESPPPKTRCHRCDSLLNSDDSLFVQEKPWTQNISGLLRDTLADYLYSIDSGRYDAYNTQQQYTTDIPYQYPEYTHETPQYDNNRHEPPSPSVLKKFFKKRTSTCATQTSGSPLKTRPSVKWHCENGTYMITPREDAGMEFLGPIYFAKSIDDFGPFQSGTMDKDMNQSVV